MDVLVDWKYVLSSLSLVQFPAVGTGNIATASLYPVVHGGRNTQIYKNDFYKVPTYYSRQYTTIRAAYSTRVVVPGYTGPVVRLDKGDASTSQLFYTDALQTFFSTQPMGAGMTIDVWMGTATTAYVNMWYDQSGFSNDMSQITLANKPKLVKEAINTGDGEKWVLRFTGATTLPFPYTSIGKVMGVTFQYKIDPSTTPNGGVLLASVVEPVNPTLGAPNRPRDYVTIRETTVTWLNDGGYSLAGYTGIPASAGWTGIPANADTNLRRAAMDGRLVSDRSGTFNTFAEYTTQWQTLGFLSTLNYGDRIQSLGKPEDATNSFTGWLTEIVLLDYPNVDLLGYNTYALMGLNPQSTSEAKNILKLKVYKWLARHQVEIAEAVRLRKVLLPNENSYTLVTDVDPSEYNACTTTDLNDIFNAIYSETSIHIMSMYVDFSNVYLTLRIR